MSFRSALARSAPLQPEYVRRDAVAKRGAEAVFRFSVPVLRVRDVQTTVAWYKRHLGFSAEAFPENGGGPTELAILERDGVQLLVRRGRDVRRTSYVPHSGWDLYLFVDGVDLGRLEASVAATGEVVRPLTTMGSTMAELEIRDPDGYVLCIGGRTQTHLTQV
jgi:catechol 2,3-dioxygenase-like lactoylglutathione lyase family enzyme